MAIHAKLSPSGSARWIACPGSIREEAKYPQTNGPASIDGTRTHSLLPIAQMTNVSAAALIGQTYTDEHGTWTVDKDRADRIQVALDYINERRALYGPCMVKTETPVDPTFLIGRKDMTGIADVIIEAPTVARTLEVIDYKDGIVQVPAEDNSQLEIYVIGALAALRIPINQPYPYDVVRMTIVQPKLALTGQHPISGWEVPVSYLLGRLGRYAVLAAATDAPDAPLVPGESQCRWCRAKGNCAALTASTLGSIEGLFGAVDLPMAIAEKEPNEISDEKIREILEAAPMLRRLIESVEAEALRRIKSGHPVPGLKAVYGRGSRSWSLPEDEMAAKLVKMGIPKASVYESKLISVAKAEKVTWTKRDGTQMQLSPRQIKTMSKEYVTQMSGKLTVVPEADERPGVVLDAAPLFAAVEAPADLPAWMQ